MSTIESTGSLPAGVSGAARPEQRKFERLLDRVVLRQEGETRLHHIAVLVSSAVFLPLIAIADGIRYAGFKAGEKNEKVAQYFDGKSWSLIDRVSTASKKIADQAATVWTQVKGQTVSKFKELTTKKPVTLEALNGKSEKAIVKGVAQLIEGYEAHNNSSSITPKADGLIAKAQKTLWAQVIQRVKDNAQGSNDFLEQLDAAKQLVQTTIEKQAEGKFYVADKNFRGESLPALAPQALFEFAAFINGVSQKTTLAELALEKNSLDADPVSGLAKLVNGGIITQEQALKALSSRASSLYNLKLASSLNEAEAALSDLLSSATSKGVANSLQVKEINRSIQPGLDKLAEAAAKDLFNASCEDEAAVRSALSSTADKLVANERLSALDVTAFVTKAYDQLGGYKTAREEAKKDAAIAAEVEAARAAEIAALPGQLTQALDLLGGKQQILDGKFDAYNALNQEVADLRNRHSALKKTKVEMLIEGSVVKVELRNARRFYHDALDDFTRGSLSPAESSARLLALINNNEGTKGQIEELDQVSLELDQKVAQRLGAYQEIHSLFDEVEREKAIFDHFYSIRRSDLEESSTFDSRKKEIATKDVQQFKKLQDISRVSLQDRLKGRPEVRVTGAPRDNFLKLISGTDSAEPGATAPSAPELQTA